MRNIPQEGLFKQNALSPIAAVKKAHEATKILDFSNQVQEGKNEAGDQNLEVGNSCNEIEDLIPEVEQDNITPPPLAPLEESNPLNNKKMEEITQVQEGKNDVEDQNLEVEDSCNEKEDLSPEVIEQDKISPTPPQPRPAPLEESNPLNNEEVEKMAIESFPSEILAIIFKFLPISYRPAIVCRLWKEVFDEVNPIKLLQAGKFYKALKDRPLSYYAKDRNEFLRLQGAIQGNSLTPWMDKCMQECGSEAEEECIWQNLWLNSFTINENVSSPKIQKIMDFLKQKNIAIFFPRLHLEGLIEFLSDEEIESVKEPIKEAIRLNFIKIGEPYFKITKFLQKLFEYPGISLSVIQKNGMSLQFVPEEKRTAELCFLAVQNYGYALKYVPEEKRTTELCLLAVQEDGLALVFVPEEKRTEEICRAAVKQNGEAFKYAPKKMQTAELYFIASQH